MRISTLFVLLCIAFNTAADDIQLKDGAPEQYVVQKGDSLWGIAERFLKNPWKWPELWRMNQEKVKKPHRLAPGDILRLTREDGAPKLVREGGERLAQDVKLRPSAKSEALVINEEAVPTVPAEAIWPLMSRGGVAMPEDLSDAPRILGANDPRVMFGKGDLVYAGKAPHDTLNWRIVRLGRPLNNPANPKEVLAYELTLVGEAVTEKPGNPQLLRITSNEQEVLERDHLMPVWSSEPPQFVPHAPAIPVEARIVTSLGGQAQAGTWMTLVLDKGLVDGIEEGHVLALFLAGRSVSDPSCTKAAKLAFLAGGHQGRKTDCDRDADNRAVLPDERVGLAVVYRVFNRLAYALVMKGSQPVTTGDVARNP
ncbi:MAG: LysM peptidoglycan-binding domain-containing protein [Betaproteobacteria bacterium]|nr:LysM peptidoglycan-binding domain-containing protein [Betaproteobacteria bacterium]